MIVVLTVQYVKEKQQTALYVTLAITWSARLLMHQLAWQSVQPENTLTEATLVRYAHLNAFYVKQHHSARNAENMTQFHNRRCIIS